MKTYMVVARFKSGVTPEEIKSMIPDEQARAKALENEGAIGGIKVAMPKRHVFIEAFAENESQALRNIESLPMAKLWEIEIYETTPPAGVQN